MRRIIMAAIFTGIVWTLMLAAVGNWSTAAAADDQVALRIDDELAKAIEKGDRSGVGRLLADDLTWTGSNGRTLNSAEVLRNLPTLAAGYEANVTIMTFGRAAVIQASSQKVHFLRVWMKRPTGWRLLLYHEVTLGQKPMAVASQVPASRYRAIKIPFRPKDRAEQAIIDEEVDGTKAEVAHDAKAWSRYFADGWVSIDATRSEPQTKAERMAEISAEKKSSLVRAPRDWKSVRMWELGDVIVMKSMLGQGEMTLNFSRVFIKTNGAWKMLVSYRSIVAQ